MKNKNGRRERFQANEKKCEELLAELEEWKQTLVAGSAFRLAFLAMLDNLPEVGGIKKVALGRMMKEGLEREMKNLTAPKVEEMEEQEFN